MRIVQLLETSLVDWDGKITAVLFLAGCNFRCPFCQNHELAWSRDDWTEIPWPDVAARLRDRRDWLDGVVVTGGEPTVHEELPELLTRIRELGLPVKLDTNGSWPDRLERLAADGLVDYVAMDLKTAPDERYHEAAGRPVDQTAILRSARSLLAGRVDYEFRTTLVPGLVGADEVTALARSIAGARRLFLQQLIATNAWAPELRAQTPYTRAEADALADHARSFVPAVALRGRFI